MYMLWYLMKVQGIPRYPALVNGSVYKQQKNDYQLYTQAVDYLIQMTC